MVKWNLITTLESIINTELERATSLFGSFHNAHEGYAVLLEEVDELWEAVKLNQKRPERLDRMYEEAIHVATMAIRFLHDCCSEKLCKGGEQ